MTVHRCRDALEGFLPVTPTQVGQATQGAGAGRPLPHRLPHCSILMLACLISASIDP